MSSTMGDVSLIKDEDLLKKMWQESQDTEVKREIRTRMCRLREERLRDLYASPEGQRVILEIEGTGKATHTDSILDHSFTGMKRKEVRDSESPTKDISYGGLRGKPKDHGWEIMTSNERSDDGKYQKTTKQATTSGTEIIEKGKIDYSADCKQQSSLYRDGDDKNYVKSSGSDSSSVIKQVATGGDENSKFSASSTHSESSSKSYTEKHSVSNNDLSTNQIRINAASSNNNDAVVRKVYTHDTPNELKNHPSYIDGNTRVTKETRTLSDGTVVTTTKYETIAKTKSTASQNYSSSSTTQHKSSTTSQSSHSIDQVGRNETRVKQIEAPKLIQTVEAPFTLTTDVASCGETTSSHVVAQEASKHTSTKHHVSTNLDDQITIKTNERCFSDTQKRPVDSRTQIVRDTSDDSNRYDSTTTRQTFDDSTTKRVEETVQQSKRQPIKPPKSELDESPKPTAGQYDTTYRTDYTNKKISVEVSPTHDAFARSLRSISPDRTGKCSSPARGSFRTTSSNSLRSSTSPEKKYPNYRESSPISRNHSTDTYIHRRSPEKKSEIIKKERISSTHSLDTYNRNVINTTVTRQKQRHHERSTKSPSPTKIYHVEYIRDVNDVTTDLDTDETCQRNVDKKIETFRSTRPTSLEVITTTKKSKKVTDRSPTSPLKDCKNKSPLKEVPRRFSPSPTKSGGASPSSPHLPKDKTFRRRDTYEERCRQILGITEKNETRRESFEKTFTTKRSDTEKKVTSRKEVQTPRKGSPEKKHVDREITEFPSQIRKSPSPSRRTTTLRQETSETEIRDSSQKYVRPCSSRESSKSPSPLREAPCERLIEITKVVTSKYEPAREYRKSPDISEFPAQVRKSPERQLPEKERPYKEAPGISEFPAQVRRTPEREPLEKLPEKGRPHKEGPGISEFPAQIRRTPEREPFEKLPEKERPHKEGPKISEFPAQIRRSPERPLEDLPQKGKPCKEAEFPAYARKSPERRPLEKLPEKERPHKEGPGISEFPAQIRRTPEREPFEKLPEKERPHKEGPKISEFPAQIRRSPERQPLENLPQKGKPCKEAEFPTHARKSPERRPLEKLPEKERPHKEGPKISEFPAQIRRTPEREPFEKLPEKERPQKEGPKISEFPAQIRRTPEREPFEKLPEKERPHKEGPKISEFPAQIRRSPERQPLEDLPQKGKPCKEAEFPAHARKSPERRPLEKLPEKERPYKEGPGISEFPAQIRRTPEREPFEKLPEKERPHKEAPKISEFPAQARKSPERRPLEKLPEKERPQKEGPKISEFPSQVRRSPERQPTEKPPQKSSQPKRTESPTQTRRTPEKQQPPQKLQEKSATPGKSEFPAQVRRSPERQSVEKTQEKKTLVTKSHYICEYPTQKRTTEPTRPAKKIPKQEPKPKHLDKQPSSKSLKEPGQVPIKQKQPTKKQRTASSSSCEEEIATHEYIFQSEARVPVIEPVVTKKFVPLLYDDDDEPISLSEHVSQSRLEKEITKIDNVTNKTVKKDSPERTLTTEFIIHEKIDTDYNINKKNTIVVTDKKLKKPGKTEYMSEYCKTNTKTLQNGDITKKYITTKVKDIPDTRKQTPIKKTPSKTQLGTKTSPNKPLKKPFSEVTQKIINKSTKLETTVKPRPVPESPRHVVTTTITTTLTKTPKSNKTKPSSITSRPKLTNGHPPTDEVVTVTEKKPYSRTSKTPSKQIKPKQDKCITTKSIIINNDTEKEVIINLQRSQSSREATPDRICPLPVTSDDEHAPRYPDQITEPDDPAPRKFKPVVHQPILEDEDVDHFSETKRIITEVDKVDEYDESLLSVDKKISKFLDTAEQLTKQSEPKGPAPKVERPILIVDKDLEQDECLLSVSDKVNKFISTAEQLTVSQTTQQERPKTPVGRNSQDQEPVADRMETISIIIDDENVCSVTKPKPAAPAPAPERPKSPRCVNYQDEKHATKKISTTVAERMTKFTTTTPVTNLSKIEPRKPHDSTTTTPSRKPPNNYESIKGSHPQEPKRGKSPDLPDSTPKSSRKSHPEEPKSIFRLRSTESIKRAKALFENGVTVNKPREVSRPLFDSKKPFDSVKPHKDQDVCGINDNNEQRRSLTSRSFQEDTGLKSTKLVLQRYRPNSPEKVRKPSSRSQTPEPGDYVKPSSRKHTPTPERDVPGYMKPLDRSLRQHSPHRETLIDQSPQPTPLNHTKPKERSQSRSPSPSPQQPVRETRFGVTLKKTEAGKTTTTTTTTTTTSNLNNLGQKHRPSSASLDLEIEDIYEVDVLEYMLETATSYEVRRRVRAQIRLVKKLISDNQLTSYIRTRKITASSRTKERTTSPPKIKPGDVRETKSPERKRKSPSPDRRPKSPVHHQDTKIVKKTTQQTKVTQVLDDKPSWVTQRNLKKASERPPTAKITNTRRAASPPKREKTTDLITSSYGVGPTDENGTPLFGLKALKAQKNSNTTTTTTTTKVQGTVLRSHYYSENGEEPVGEISFTKYSTDPKDLGCDEVTRDKGITSVTTTQKFGYKDTPNLQSLTNRNQQQQYQIDDESQISKTAVRRNSVKALSEKFMETTTSTSTSGKSSSAETSCKQDKQGSYPKAGLILRTSSFKDSTKKNDESRSGDLKESVTVQSSSRMTSGKETFLSNTSKVTGVQDVISRMKTEEVREGDTAEDVEARGLLNKFLGASVILAGMEGHITKTSTSSATASVSSCAVSKAVTRVTTTLMEGGKQVTRTRIFQHPVSEEELETVWDEETIRLLLENSSDYEERRRIRARLRQVMADKEACTELVDKASQEQSAGSLDGESLLLPLLQGLLDAPDKEQAGADSGTESGEDQRTNLIAEVQGALDKLSASLLSDATDISSERKRSLLQLVTKLQAGLATSLPGSGSSTSPNSHGRFGKRRQRQNRHTVGVSSEELADARKLIEEITLGDVLPGSSNGNLQKQRSEGSIIPTSSSNSSFRSISLSHSKSPVKNAIAKPFSSSNSISATSSSGNTPTDPPDGMNYLFNDEPKQDDYKIMENPLYKPEDKSIKRRSLTQAFSPPNQESIRSKTPLQAGNIMVRKIKAEEEPQGSETDDDPSTLKNHQENIPDLLMQNNAIYSFPPPQLSHEEKANKFINRKIRMRRANTIDIPKPLNFYADNESDSDFNDEEYNRQRRHTYLALRGPIRVGNQANPSTAPPLEPKTESDKKFLAFINKHNENTNTNTKTSLWSNRDNRGPVWNSKFGKIQRNFEKAANTGSASTPTTPQNSARNFWKANDDSVMAKSGYANMGPKISRQSARNLQQMFEEKQKQNQYDDSTVITGSLKLKTKPLEQEKVYRFVPQPLPVNQFSHAPQSAFQPISKKNVFTKPDVLNIPKQAIREESDSESSTLFLYSPKSIQNDSSSTSSPISTKPWVGNSGEHRVLSIAASKFERPPEMDLRAPAPLRANKEKITIPSYLQRQQQEEPEKLTAPYLGRSVPQKLSTVKKLSDQYSNLNSTGEQYKQYTHDGTRYVNKGLQQKNYEPYHNNNPPQYAQQQYNRYNRQYSQPERYESPAYYSNGCYDYRNQTPRREDVIIPPTYQEPHYEDQQYTSNFQYRSQPSPHTYYNNVTVPKKQQNYNVNITMENRTFIPTPTPTPSPTTPTPAPNGYQHDDYQENRPKFESQLSGGSVHEHNAVSSKVMSGPVGQQAVTVAQKTPKSRDGHDMDAAFSLRNALQNVSKDKDDTFRYKPHEISGFKYDPLEKPEPTSPRPSSFKYRSVEDQSRALSNGDRNIAIARPIQQGNKQSIASESVNLNSRGESVVTSKFQIPVINVANETQKRPSSSQVLSKSDSWHQICLQNQNIAQKPLPKSSPNARTVTKSKSSHSLAVPKMFEAGISRDEVDHKKKSIEAYLKGPAPANKNVKRAINRTKTSEKSSSFKSTGICRSRTLPDVICPDLLDESNVEEAFDDLFKASS